MPLVLPGSTRKPWSPVVYLRIGFPWNSRSLSCAIWELVDLVIYLPNLFAQPYGSLALSSQALWSSRILFHVCITSPCHRLHSPLEASVTVSASTAALHLESLPFTHISECTPPLPVSVHPIMHIFSDHLFTTRLSWTSQDRSQIMFIALIQRTWKIDASRIRA